jgi:hypothetical protein
MATQVFSSASPVPRRSAARPANPKLERVFFSSMALLLCLVVAIGFTPSYYGAGMLRATLPSPILHIHGAVFTLWMVLYVVQSALISAKRVRWHRSLGTVAFCLPPLMIVLGFVAALDALHRRVRIGPLDPEVSAAIPLIGLTSFIVVIFASWKTRRNPGAHKRLILLATIGLVEAAFGRFPWAQMGLAPAQGAVIGLGTLIVLVLAYDLISLHRIHRATAWAAPLVFVTNAFSVPLGMTPAWHSFAVFLENTIGRHL